MTDRVGMIETKGVEPVTGAERHGRPRELFWLWFAANFGILGVVYGGMLATYGVNLWQALLVVTAAALISYGIVALVSLAGPRFGLPTLAFSRMVFGPRGNIGPALLSWLTLVGWEIVTAVIATYALVDLAGLAGIGANAPVTAAALGLNVLLLAALGILGHATLVWTLRVVTVVFGLLTVVAAWLVAAATPWAQVLERPAGAWGPGALAALGVIAAATGMTWVNCGADFTRYLPVNSPARSIVGWTVAGAGAAVLLTIMLGFLLAVRVPGLAEAANPISEVRQALPSWMAVPLLVTAVVGLLSGGAAALYSSGMSLLAAGVRVPRWVSVLIDGMLATAGACYLLFVASDFVTAFTGFVQLATIGLIAWAGVVLVWLLLRRRPVAWIALVAWVAGIVAGLAAYSAAASLAAGAAVYAMLALVVPAKDDQDNFGEDAVSRRPEPTTSPKMRGSGRAEVDHRGWGRDTPSSTTPGP